MPYIPYFATSTIKMVAGAGFEPTTFGLWARRATRLLHPASINNNYTTSLKQMQTIITIDLQLLLIHCFSIAAQQKTNIIVTYQETQVKLNDGLLPIQKL